jgi:hypothetical protein
MIEEYPGKTPREASIKSDKEITLKSYGTFMHII